MATDLEYAHGKGAMEDGFVRSTELREPDERAHEEETVTCYEAELNKCEGNGVAEGRHDRLPRVGGEGGGGIPQAAQEVEACRGGRVGCR